MTTKPEVTLHRVCAGRYAAEVNGSRARFVVVSNAKKNTDFPWVIFDETDSNFYGFACTLKSASSKIAMRVAKEVKA